MQEWVPSCAATAAVAVWCSCDSMNLPVSSWWFARELRLTGVVVVAAGFAGNASPAQYVGDSGEVASLHMAVSAAAVLKVRWHVDAGTCTGRRWFSGSMQAASMSTCGVCGDDPICAAPVWRAVAVTCSSLEQLYMRTHPREDT